MGRARTHVPCTNWRLDHRPDKCRMADTQNAAGTGLDPAAPRYMIRRSDGQRWPPDPPAPAAPAVPPAAPLTAAPPAAPAAPLRELLRATAGAATDTIVGRKWLWPLSAPGVGSSSAAARSWSARKPVARAPAPRPRPCVHGGNDRVVNNATGPAASGRYGAGLVSAMFCSYVRRGAGGR